MNWQRIHGHWQQVKGRVKAQWGRLTDDDQAVVDGRCAQLAGKIQAHYGAAKEDVEKLLAAWERQASNAWIRGQ